MTIAPRTGDDRRAAAVAPGTLRALRLLAANPEGVDLATLSGALGGTATSVVPVVHGLCRAGYIEPRPQGGYRLRPGPSWDPAIIAPALPAVLSEVVGDLFRRTQAWAYLAEWTDDDHIDVLEVRGHQGLARMPELPTRLPPSMAHVLAVGKVLVAHAPERRARLDPSRWQRYTPATVTDPAAFDRELARVRHDGYARERDEFAAGFACLSAPIADPGGRVGAALAISLPTARFDAEYDELVDTVTAAARTAHRHWYR